VARPVKAIAGVAYGGALLLLIAVRALQPAVALAGVAAAGVLALLAWRLRSGLGGVAALVLLVGALTAAVGTDRVASLASRWSGIAERQAALGVAALEERVAAASERAFAAARSVAASPRAWGGLSSGSPEQLFAALAEARAGRADALFVLAADGELVAWAGRHQGYLPDSLRSAPAGLMFAEGRLFDYLYAVVDRPDGSRVVGAVLLEADPALAERAPPSIASAVAASTGARPHFGAGAGPPGASWRLAHGGAVIAHAVLDAGQPAAWRAAAVERARALGVALAVFVLLLALAAWLVEGAGRAGAARFAPIAALAMALAVAPQPGGDGASLFHPAMFLLPVGDGVTLWGLAVLATPFLAAAALWGGLPRGRWAIPTAAVGTGLVFWAGASLLGVSTSDGLYRAGGPLWFGLQVAATAILGAATSVLLPRADADERKHRGGWPIAAGLSLAAAMGIALALLREPWQAPLPGAALAWAIPAALVAAGSISLRAGGLRRWLVGGALAATAMLPQISAGSAAARVRAAQADVERLAAATDPFLEFLLRRFVEEARTRHRRGEDGSALLYRSWVGSGLAAEAYPVRLALWGADGSVSERLDVTDARGDGAASGVAITSIVDAVRQGGRAIVRLTPSPGIRGGAAAPLDSARVVSAAVLPRRSLAAEGLAAATLAARPPPPGAPVLTLTTSTSRAAMGDAQPLLWARSAAGVRGEGDVRLEDGVYHAHVELAMEPAVVRIARGALLATVDLLVLALIWAIAHALAGGGPPPLSPWVPALGSFRMRVTLALFLFFLAPALAFGAVAFRALAGTAEREAEAAATRTSAQAAEMLTAAGGNLQTVASLVGFDVLFYQNGELLTSSRPELVDLGVHDAWLPPGAFLALRQQEALAVERRRNILGRRAVAAYRRLPSGTVGVLALPGGAAATRRAELTDMLLFAVLLGAVLSLALSLAAGRLLARPIGLLSRAASAVGAGRLKVQLPGDRRDEFGELFRSFNRMTRRLRRARTRELRSARVLAWGEMARQVAHEIKNPLTPIRLSVQHIRRAYRDDRADFGDILEANVDQVLHEIDRLSDIARAFARYGTPAEERPALQAVDVGAVVRDVEALYASGEAGFAPAVTTAAVPPAAARDGELREVLINLLENARAAIGENGSVHVEVRPGEGEVLLEVRDDGEGIPQEVLASVFDPRFSTRSSGTGLGLAIVRRLVEDWGGSIDVESQPGGGSTFRVHMLPFDDPA
jgi:signal transduction histidine kinase